MNSSNNTQDQYYAGGLSELVASPTPLTYSFLKDWFVGSASIGYAMDLLKLPYQKVDRLVLEIVDGEVMINLKNEEATLYANTVFYYKLQENNNNQPQLKVSLLKLFNPFCILNSLKILFVQSSWILNPQKTVSYARRIVESIPENYQGSDIGEIDNLLKSEVWPKVIAVGLISEFYSHYVGSEAKGKATIVNEYISKNIAKSDWFFASIANQLLVKDKKLGFDEYIAKYGIRADKDYELSSPRWYQIQDEIRKRIENFSETPSSEFDAKDLDPKLINIADTAVALQLLRSEAKRRTLIHIDKLRSLILQTAGSSAIENLTKEKIENGDLNAVENNTEEKKESLELKATKGCGISVCQGEVSGIVKNISNNSESVGEGVIGVFPNSSPEFAIQYPKCVGLIFLKGGQTSHGAIVAREFGIPAIIDSKILGIKDGVKIKLNGASGEWQIL